MAGRRQMAVTRAIRALALVAGLVTSACLPSVAEAASCAAAETVQDAASAFIDAARSGSVSAFSSALSRYVNVDAMALSALGKFRGKLPPERRAEYVRNAQRYMSQFLADNAGRFQGNIQLTIKSCSGNLVKSSIGGGSDIAWRVSGNRIDDVQVSGIWLGLQLRQEFTNIIRQNQGYVSGLIDYLGRRGAGELPHKKN